MQEQNPVRVVAQHRGHYEVIDTSGERNLVTLSGALRHAALSPSDLPTVGDRVMLREETIVAIEPRVSLVVRRGGQVLAANADQAWIVTAYGRDLSVRRVERFIALATAARIEPVVLVNKADLGDPPLGELRAVSGGAPVLPVSALTGMGVDALDAQLGEGRTAVLLGSSGAGKSTLVNRLAGREMLATGAVREYDERGRHTTTHRELVELPSGGLLIDTPGIKVVGLSGGGGAGAAFADIDALAATCRFADCTHLSEPGCAVRDAVAPERFEAWLALGREAAWEASREDQRANSARKRQSRMMSKEQRRMYRNRDRNGGRR